VINPANEIRYFFRESEISNKKQAKQCYHLVLNILRVTSHNVNYCRDRRSCGKI